MISGVCFFFKQKTAYEMRISDWSSDVCSSDLLKLKRILSKVRANSDGSAAIEFAFTAPLLIFTIVGIMEFSMIMFLNASLEGGLRDAARFEIGRASCRDRVCQSV